ncbi:pyridoxal phosphate-dependent aminotransferase [Streptomyces sp. RB6PN25]|uniref:Pyridoxal phosphate-dependent aminotransferase n=1 Tax=Streptomyces humicola TaxID=2953240 RepID=A0ABT1Q1C0_9ACTN|nr:pyridoxal phosphate-dependent aminotransferase [Streptomyces humicola]MCQ4083731.1 pyridoxal phosphate-dependent aminotransferase [Streptomyces humicola]
MQRTAAGSRPAKPAITDPGLPVPPLLAERLAAAAPDDGEPQPVGGGPEVRTAACGYWERRGLPTGPERVVFGPGPGSVLLALLTAAGGDLLLPRPGPAWYEPQARLLGRTAHYTPTPSDCGGVPDPFALLETVRRARADGADPRLLVLSVADDPTGSVTPPELLHEACEAAADAGLLIVSDETYRDVLHDPHTVLVSPAEMLHDRTVVLTDLGAGLMPPGWPAALARFPEEGPAAALQRPVMEALTAARAVAAAPVRAAAVLALTEPPELRAHAAAANRLHAAVAGAAHRTVTARGAVCPPPQAGFHLYPDLTPLRPALDACGITRSDELEDRLPACLSGHRFGEDPAALRVRITTSAFYGSTPAQRRTALEAAEPLQVPHVAGALAGLDRALIELTA